MRQWKVTVLAVCIFAIMLVAYFWGDSESEDISIKESASERQIIEIPDHEIASIEIHQNQRETVTIAADRSGDGVSYEITPSTEKEVNSRRVDLLFRYISDFRAKQNVTEEPENYRQYGLDDPSAKITVYLIDDTQLHMSIGDTSPLDSKGRYLQVDGESTIYLIDENRLEFLLAPLEKWFE